MQKSAADAAEGSFPVPFYYGTSRSKEEDFSIQIVQRHSLFYGSDSSCFPLGVSTFKPKSRSMRKCRFGLVVLLILLFSIRSHKMDKLKVVGSELVPFCWLEGTLHLLCGLLILPRLPLNSSFALGFHLLVGSIKCRLMPISFVLSRSMVGVIMCRCRFFFEFDFDRDDLSILEEFD